MTIELDLEPAVPIVAPLEDVCVNDPAVRFGPEV